MDKKKTNDILKIIKLGNLPHKVSIFYDWFKQSYLLMIQ